VSFISLNTNRQSPFRIRPTFVLVCVGVLATLLLSDVIGKLPLLQQALLILAAFAVGSGWLLLFRDYGQASRARAWISFVTAIYLTACLPAFFFELHPWRWLVHRTVSLYVRPWTHWGLAAMCLSIIGSFCASGRARVALVAASVALIILRASMATWLF